MSSSSSLNGNEVFSHPRSNIKQLCLSDRTHTSGCADKTDQKGWGILKLFSKMVVVKKESIFYGSYSYLLSIIRICLSYLSNPVINLNSFSLNLKWQPFGFSSPGTRISLTLLV